MRRLALLAALPAALAAAPRPVPALPGEHPRLYLRAQHVEDLRRRTEHPTLKPVWEELQALGKKNVQIALEVDALRYLLTRDAALGRRTAAAALETLERATFDLSQQDVTRPIGRMMVTGAIAYDWCYQVLSAAQKQAFVAQFVRLAKQLECGYPPREIGSVTGHGSEWMLMRDMMSAGIAIHDEYPEMYQLAAGRFFANYVPARDFWYHGHAFHQGSAYAETRFVSDMYPLWIFARLGVGNVFNPEQRYVPYQWIYMRRPDGQLLRAGDGQSKPPKLRSLLCASYYGDGYVLADYRRDPGIDPMSKIFELLWSDPDLAPRPVSELPLSRYFGGPYGWMVARTGWDEASVIAEMKVNIYNFTNHQHNDAGAFQIYYKGPLAVDSGVYQGSSGAYGSPHHANYYKRSIAHNTLLVYDPAEKFNWSRRELRNDGGQRLPNNWREPRNIEELLNSENGYKTGKVLGHAFGPDARRPEYTYLAGDITEAYGPKVKRVERSFVFLNLGGGRVPAAMVVYDRVTAADPAFKKYWLLHAMEEPVLRGDTAVVALKERGWTGKLVQKVVLPAAADMRKVGGPGKEFWVFGENFANEPRGRREDYETGAWRVEVSPAKASAEDRFLNVMQVMDGDAAPLVVERVPCGVRVGDRVVCFAEGTAGVSFTASRAGKFLVAGLAEGVWQVRRDGKTVQPAAQAGVLWFEGPPGRYEVRR